MCSEEIMKLNSTRVLEDSFYPEENEVGFQRVYSSSFYFGDSRFRGWGVNIESSINWR